jgi:hypothetical protein
MATENSTSSPSPTSPSPTENERLDLALDASREIESCVNAVLGLNEKVDTVSDEQRAVRTLLLRIRQMAGVIMSAADDVSVKELRDEACFDVGLMR